MPGHEGDRCPTSSTASPTRPAFLRHRGRLVERGIPARQPAKAEDHEVAARLHASAAGLAKHERFAGAVTLLQMAVGRSALAVRFAQRWRWFARLLAGVGDLGLTLIGWLLT